MNSSDYSPCLTIKQWEEAGASLVTMLKDYANLCLNLGTNSLLEGANSEDLVSRIESTLAEVHTTISRHLDESCSALARTRNRLVSSIYSLPEEILSKIFMDVVYDHNDSGISEPLTMKQEIWLIYRRVYTLLGVCSAWRDIAMNRGALWSVVPVVLSPFVDKWRPSELSLQRAGGGLLHLAVAIELTNSLADPAKILIAHGPRFHTINISMDDPAEIRDTINGLLQHGALESLSELSIQCIATRAESHRLPQRSDYIIPRHSPQEASFAKVLWGLATFRTSGVHFHWATMAFSTRLVELRIQQVVLGYDDEIIPFMQALSSASNLRDLKLIAVSTFRGLFSLFGSDESSHATVTFPALQSLLLQDLYLNTLERLLPVMAPGPYSLALFLTPRCLEINTLVDVDFANNSDFEGLRQVMRRTPIDTLMIDGHFHDEWVTMSKLGTLFKTMPTLRTLKFHKWNFGKGLCKILMRMDDTRIPPEGPALQNLHLTSVRIHNKKVFRDMISGHSLQGLVLGGEYQDINRNRGHYWESLQEGAGFVKELRGIVPDLRLVEGGYHPPEFESVVWRLW